MDAGGDYIFGQFETFLNLIMENKLNCLDGKVENIVTGRTPEKN